MGLVMVWVQKHMEVVARVRGVVRVALTALLVAVERAEPERPALWEAAVVGWSAATLAVELRALQAA